MSTITLLLVSTAVAAPPIPEDHPLSQVATELSAIAKELQPDASFAQDNGNVSLSYKTRPFMVHAARKTGEFAEKARSVIGPDYNGLIVRVRLHEGRYAGAAKLPSNGARPYWRTFANAYTIARGKQHLHLYIEYGLRTDPKLVARVRKVLTSVVDNAPATNEINDAKKQVGDVDKRSTIWAALSIDQPIFVGKQTERLMVHFALVNDGQRPIDPAVGSWRLNINGKDHPDSQLMFGNGPRDDRWESLPAGEHLSFAYATGDWFEEPGIYTIYCRGHGFQSAPVVLRVQP